MTRARICLSMIVKDEAPVILRCLASVAPLIDHWIIVDTGSSDGTPSIVREFFASAGIPGTLHERPWRDFATNRTEALEYARPHGDYSLIIDADDALEPEPGFAWPELTGDAYGLRIRDTTISYERTQLVSSALPWAYRGILHEHPFCDGARPATLLDGLVMRRNHDGARRRDPLTYARDAELLERALATETDQALRTRYTYYLGQSYRDAGEPLKAADAYGRRVALGGWEEERWSALLNQARCLRAAGDGDGFVRCATQAFEARPQRAEPLLDLANYLRSYKEYEQAMVFLELAAHIKWPTEDRLFVEDFAYRFGIRQEMSICGFYCSAARHKELGRFAANDLALDPAAPQSVRNLARQNLAFYARPAAELMPSWRANRVDWTPPEGWHAMNPSIERIDGANWLIMRTVNFDISDGVNYVVADNGPVRTRNYLVALDAALQPTSTVEIALPANLPPAQFGLVLGFEDMRLFGWRGAMWCVCASRQRMAQGWYEMVLARIEFAKTGAVAADWRVLKPGGEQRHEKNWMPRVVDERLEFIYGLDPVRVLDDSARTVRQLKPEGALEHLRGGSQAMPFDGGWLLLTHEVVLINERRNYLHRFVWLDADDQVRRLTEPFVFLSRGIEFAAGLAWHEDGQTLIVSFGARDSEAWTATVAGADVRAALTSHR